MKLRNKKTGEIQECSVIPIIDGYVNEYEVFEKAGSLAELNENWEDYEKPKEYWFVNTYGDVNHQEMCDNDGLEKTMRSQLSQIGNYFETKEEAEKAVEKLKAWKRLKDIGFKFIGKSYEYKEEKNFGSVFFETGSHEKIMEVYEDIVYFYDDIDIIFGGNE